MKFSIVRTDNKHAHHLSVKTAEWVMERIKSDTKAGDIAKLREHVYYFGNMKGYDKLHTIAEICPSVELTKTENGLLEIVAFNGLVTLHIGGLLRPGDRRTVKEASKQLPMTFAALTGADGRSVEVLVAVESDNVRLTSSDGTLPAKNLNEGEMDTFYKRAYETALGVYNAILPQPEIGRAHV